MLEIESEAERTDRQEIESSSTFDCKCKILQFFPPVEHLHPTTEVWSKHFVTRIGGRYDAKKEIQTQTKMFIVGKKRFGIHSGFKYKVCF